MDADPDGSTDEQKFKWSLGFQQNTIHEGQIVMFWCLMSFAPM